MSTRTDALAHRLSAQIDGLSRTLLAVGAHGPESRRLLEAAAVAAMHAVSLEALAGAAPERRRPAAAEPEPAPRPLARAA